MKRMLFVMNPYAGTRKANRVLAEILEIFNRADYEVTVHMTAGAGDGARVVAHRGRGYDMIVGCGGDGTFNETISGMMRGGFRVPIGYIPAGSTNDFAASMGLSTDPVEAANDIVLGVPQAYDIGQFDHRHFSYVASFGAFTRASYATPQTIKNALGHLAYVLEGIQELSQIRKEHIRMVIDGEVVEDDFLFGAICNSTSVGGILTLDPDQVDMSDGKLEVLLVRAPKNLLEITECITAVQTLDYNDCEMLTFRSASEIEIDAPEDMPWTLDGEREDGHRHISVRNCHLAYSLVKRVRYYA